jgi:hypothetical protein
LENVLFQNNLFKEMTGPALEATSFKNLVIRQNSFINREKAPITLRCAAPSALSLEPAFGWKEMSG